MDFMFTEKQLQGNITKKFSIQFPKIGFLPSQTPNYHHHHQRCFVLVVDSWQQISQVRK